MCSRHLIFGEKLIRERKKDGGVISTKLFQLEMLHGVVKERGL